MPPKQQNVIIPSHFIPKGTLFITACWLPLRGVSHYVLVTAAPCWRPLRGVGDCVLTAVRLNNSEAKQQRSLITAAGLSITQAAEVIKTAILQSQERTIKNANTDVLSLNYAVGGYISQQSKQHQWGSGIIRAISEKLQRDMPGLRGFGYENLKKMRQFYETWLPYIMGSPSATRLESSENRSPSRLRKESVVNTDFLCGHNHK